MRAILFLPLAMLAACGGDEEPPGGNMAGNIAEPVLPDVPEAPPATGVQADAEIPGISAEPRETPVTAAQTQAEEPGPAVAAAVVRRYYDRIARGRAAAAWELWDDDGRASGMSRRDFADSFARFADYRATIGTPGPMEAGAGQRHVTVPVELAGTLRTGEPFAMTGTVTLHRTGVIDGASAAQRQWRISSAAIRPRPDLVPPAPEASDTPALIARYACDDGSLIVAKFDNVAETVTLRRGRETLGVLQQQPAGSGIRYTGGGAELRGKGDDATIALPGAPPLACTAD